MVRRPFRVWECRNVGSVAHIFTASSPKSRLNIISKPVCKPDCNTTFSQLSRAYELYRPTSFDPGLSEPDLWVLLLLI
jgi:hypothetical protein